MRSMFRVVLALVLTSHCMQTQNTKMSDPKSSEQSATARVMGTWRLISAGNIDKNGKFEPLPEFGPHPIGYRMYDATGHMCVSLANPNHPKWVNSEKPTNAEKLESYRVMFAYCGTYEVQQKEQRVIHRPEMASWPHYVGSEQFRP